MYDQPLLIVVPSDLDQSIPHKSQNPSVQFVHPNRCVVTNKKLLLIWNVMALFVMGTVYFYSEHEVTIQLQAQYAHVPIIERDDWDEFTQWYSGAAGWVPVTQSENQTLFNHSSYTEHSTIPLRNRTDASHVLAGTETDESMLSSGDDQPTNYLPEPPDIRLEEREDETWNQSEIFQQLKSLNLPSIDISKNGEEGSSMFVARTERLLRVVSTILNTTHTQPTINDVRRVLEGLISHYSGPMLDSISTLLDGIRNGAILDNFSSENLENLSLTFVSKRPSPCWLEVLLPGGYQQKINNRFAAASTRHMSFIYKKRLTGQTISWRMRCLPAFFLGGFPKCGTTDLYFRLRAHPSIYASGNKEPHWWTRKRLGLMRSGVGQSTPIKVYVNVYDRMADELVMEDALDHGLIVDGSASTIWDHNVPLNDRAAYKVSDPMDFPMQFNMTTPYKISRLLPESNMIILVRDPVSRAYSDFLFFNEKLIGNLAVNGSQQVFLRHQILIQINEIQRCMSRTENDAIRCAYWVKCNTKAPKVRLYVGMYHVHIEMWLRYFPSQSLMVVQTEEYNSQPTKTLQDIVHHLGLDSYPDDVIEKVAHSDHHYNARKNDAEPLADDIQNMLEDFYAPYNNRLAKLLNDEKFLWSKKVL